MQAVIDRGFCLKDPVKTTPAVHRFFLDLHDEEMEYGRLMLACLDQVAVNREVDFVPGVRDRAMRESLNVLRDIERRVPARSRTSWRPARST